MAAGPFSVTMLRVGEGEVPGPEVFWMAEWGRWFPLVFQVALVRGPEICALVNTGPPSDLSDLNEVWERVLGAQARMRRPDEDLILSRLEEHGVAADDVTHLVLTPLQLYTTGNVHHFGNASICLSERGWTHFHTTHEHPHDFRWSTMSPETLAYLTVEAWDRVRLLADEDEIVPGLRTWWAGAHHRASLAVEIDSSAGTVVVSDAFFTFRNVESGHPIGICESLEEARIAYRRARDVADRLVPLYDPLVFERYPGGVVAEAPL